jgi:hypothetical protein
MSWRIGVSVVIERLSCAAPCERHFFATALKVDSSTKCNFD